MPYITIKQSPAFTQITFEDIILGRAKMPTEIIRSETGTRTHFTNILNKEFLGRFDFAKMNNALECFCEKYSGLYKVKRTDLYDTFYLPKKSGGLRRIDAPVPELMTALRELKQIFETTFFALYHTSAFAYVPRRSTIDAIKKHQQNESHWFLKTDFSDFFGKTTPDFVMRMFSMIFPFSEVIKTRRGRDSMIKALDLCFLNGGLPQGTPISPLLTNLMMIPIDHRLSNCLRDFNKNCYAYTRYADDILISSKKDFNHKEIVDFIAKTLSEFQAPFAIKPEKTRYGSRAGSNWNLGLMLNKDNTITIGHKNKQRLRAMICNYILDRRSGRPWDLHDVQVLRGHLNYYSMVEKDYVDGVIAYNNEKFHTDVLATIKADLSA